MTDSHWDNIPKIVVDKISDNDRQLGEEKEDERKIKANDESSLEVNNSMERGRARSIDFGKMFSIRGGQGYEKDSLLSRDDGDIPKKGKSKSIIMRKFNSILRRGSDASKNEKGSITFKTSPPNNLLFALAIGKSDELNVPVTGRRGSLFVQPKGTIQHKVEVEDTLASIAARYKSTVAELKSLNRLMSPLIFPGLVLYVPDEECHMETSNELTGQKNVKFISQSRPCSPVLGKVDEEFDHAEGRLKKIKVFSGKAKYMTGGEINLSGMLTISASGVRFDPFLRMKDGEMVKDDINTIIGLVKSKMAAACCLQSASFQVDNPFEKKQEKVTEELPLMTNPQQKAIFTIASYDESLEHEDKKKANYVRLTLIRKSKDERPFVEALVKTCTPGPSSMDHHFELKSHISKELKSFLMLHYPDKLDTVESNSFTTIHTNIKVTNSTLRRKLSIAELCNLALPKLSDTSHIFNNGHVRVLREFLPLKFDGRPWQMAYGTWKHGFSLQTLYRCAHTYRNEEVALIMIKDTCSEVFGGLLCGGIFKSESFYGTGESFLFTFSPSFQIYPWSRKNECFARGNSDCFIMGSSENAIGLWIDEELHHGSSQPCATFDNDVLTTDSNFKISTLEIWTFPYELT